MAEYVVSTAVEKLTTLISQEAGHLQGVRYKVKQLRNDLRLMQSFLKDVDAKQEKSDETFREWVSQIREVAHEAEDVIETYIAVADASRKSWNLATKLINLNRVGRKIKRIRTKIDNISSQKERFGISSSSDGRKGGEGFATNSAKLRWWRQTSPNIEEDDLVDIVEDTKALITQLSSMDLRRRVVSIVGMGGLGKTTLAKKLYNHSYTKKQFDCKAFVYVSKDYNRRDTLQRVIKAISTTGDLKDLDEEDLVLKLHELLKSKRYLVVLDDVWEKVVWDSVKAAFPNGKMGSKVMLTTRNKEVALYADAMSKPLEPRFLSEDESLKLFCMKAFPGMDGMPFEFEKLGREMVVKCGGLPLAVVVLGGLLSTKRTTEEWGRMLQNIGSHLIGEDRVSAILALSYNDLSFHLKACFLHLGLFPEDFSISKTKLMHLWDAEGFLPQQQGGEMSEDVAENCLNELINRCMIQVATLTSLGRVKTLRIHDLLKDLSVSKGTEGNFLRIYNEHEAESSTFESTKFRRLAIHTPYREYAFLKLYGPYLRSIQFSYLVDQPVIDIILEHFKLLRVLDGFVMPPRGLIAVTQLRYLELKYPSRQVIVPPSIGKLKNLRTLKIESRNGWVGGDEIPNPLPNVIWKLKKLRHLYLAVLGENLRLDTLNHLQTLKYIGAGRWVEDGLASMTYLRRLGISRLSGDGADIVISIVADKLVYIQSLSMQLWTGASFATCIRLSDCVHLQKLELRGKVETLLEFPPNLVKLSLHESHLRQDSIAKLERLPNLKMLLFGANSYNGTKMVCSSDGFPQLQILHVKHLQDLWELVVPEGAMVKLKSILPCPTLKKIPPRFKKFTIGGGIL